MNIPPNILIIGVVSLIILFILVVIFAIIFILIKKNTHAFEEWKAKRKGLPLGIFFNDDNTAEWKAIKVQAGIVETKNNGSYVINPNSNYLDRNTKVILIPFSSSVGVSAPANFAQISDALKKVIKDPAKFKELRKRIMLGQDHPNSKISFLKESINFSSIKNMLNAISPHNIDAKINLMVSKKLSGRMGLSAGSLIVFVLVGLGLIALFAMVYKGKTPQVVVEKITNEVTKNVTTPRIIQ